MTQDKEEAEGAGLADRAALIDTVNIQDQKKGH
jgi:hypothetical protein